jgi:hypothetical protein
MGRATAHVARPVAQLALVFGLGIRTFGLGRDDRRARGSASGYRCEELWVLGTDALGVEALRVAELGVNVDDEALVTAAMGALLAHEIDGEVAGELDKAVVAGFCDD